MTPEQIVDGAIEHGAIQDRQELLQLVTLLLERGVKNVCEIGSYAGGTLWAWCQLSQEGFIASLDDGHIPRDLFHRWHPKMWTPRVNSHNPTLPARLKRRCPEFDFLFIDGGHSFYDAQTDYEMYSPLVRAGGIIAIHDIALVPISQDADYEVKRFWQEVKQGKEFIELDSGVNMGIGVLIK